MNVTACTGCHCEVELCELCERTDCSHAICYRCVRTALLPRSHDPWSSN